MDISLAIGLLCLGAVFGALIVVGWNSDGSRPTEQFGSLEQAEYPDDEIVELSIEQRSRRVM